jgi:hypothetical protein
MAWHHQKKRTNEQYNKYRTKRCWGRWALRRTPRLKGRYKRVKPREQAKCVGLTGNDASCTKTKRPHDKWGIWRPRYRAAIVEAQSPYCRFLVRGGCCCCLRPVSLLEEEEPCLVALEKHPTTGLRHSAHLAVSRVNNRCTLVPITVCLPGPSRSRQRLPGVLLFLWPVLFWCYVPFFSLHWTTDCANHRQPRDSAPLSETPSTFPTVLRPVGCHSWHLRHHVPSSDSPPRVACPRFVFRLGLVADPPVSGPSTERSLAQSCSQNTASLQQTGEEPPRRYRMQNPYEGLV